MTSALRLATTWRRYEEIGRAFTASVSTTSGASSSAGPTRRPMTFE